MGQRTLFVSEHELISRTLQYMITLDQLNARELAAAENLSRRYQMIVERCSRDMQRADSAAGEEKGYEASLFMGGDCSNRRVLVDPRMEEWIARKL